MNLRAKTYHFVYPFGMTLPNRSFSPAEYRYGFGNHEKDDEVSGVGNWYIFGGYGYNPRIGRRLNLDPVVNANRSNYTTFANNPLIFTDPAGNTEFYYNAKWIGTDGQNNNLTAIVKSSSIKEDIVNKTLLGKEYSMKVAHGMNNNDVLVVHNDVLREANNVLNADIADPNARELARLMYDDLNGGFQFKEDFERGGINDLVSLSKKEGASSATVSIIQPTKAKVIIHSHITESYYNSKTNNIVSSDASKAGPGDAEIFAGTEMNIIVGKSGLRPPSMIETDTRTNIINIFDNTTTNSTMITQTDATSMINGNRGDLGNIYEKSKRGELPVGTQIVNNIFNELNPKENNNVSPPKTK